MSGESTGGPNYLSLAGRCGAVTDGIHSCRLDGGAFFSFHARADCVAALVSLAAGVAFGIALAAPPGPMNAIIAAESVTRGWAAGVRAGLGAMSADALLFVLTIGGLAGVVARYGALEAVLFLVGGLLMLVFAVDAAGSLAGSFVPEGRPAAGFRKTFVLSLSNPYQLAFWLTAGVGLVRPGTIDLADHVPLGSFAGSVPITTGSPALLLGFFAGIAVWVVAYPAALVAAGDRIDVLAPIVSAGSAVVLAGFGLVFCWLGLAGLL